MLVFLGVSAIIAANWIAGPLLQGKSWGGHALHSLSGFAFGYVVMAIIASPLGRISSHYNPAITFMRWVAGEPTYVAVIYFAAQLAGSIPGAFLLLLWGRLGADVGYGATTPAPGVSLWAPIGSELISTALLGCAVLALTSGRISLRTGFHLIPALYGAMAVVAVPLSGLSTNPARTFGPAVVSGIYDQLWLYLVVPPAGATLALCISRARDCYRCIRFWGKVQSDVEGLGEDGSACSNRHAARASTRRSRRPSSIRSLIVTRIPCQRRSANWTP
ncbi:aquaporin Z [Saccharopolyspora phatthalungensis]|uniref:Aquaporin Z n=2 Tax=Saccharopolyspora phatthalungensis TaxID=664693 RepID=A0A840Q879_9PSEU|nr:aquaporin Z [Saccharopolyspora phatthalungensis]